MKAVDLYARVRRACHVDGMSQRQAAQVFGIDPKTVAKMLRFSVPPGYRRSKPPARPKLDAFTGAIDRILEEDQGRPRKQRHTARRIFQRLKAEHGYAGGETIVKAYVRERRLQGREMFVPLVHPPGHGQADFGEAVAVIGGEERKIHFFCLDLPHSDACFVKAFPAETTEAFCDGHNAAFAFFGCQIALKVSPAVAPNGSPPASARRRRQRPARRSWLGLRGRADPGSRMRRWAGGSQALFLKRQLSLPVSTMSQ